MSGATRFLDPRVSDVCGTSDGKSRPSSPSVVLLALSFLLLYAVRYLVNSSVFPPFQLFTLLTDRALDLATAPSTLFCVLILHIPFEVEDKDSTRLGNR